MRAAEPAPDVRRPLPDLDEKELANVFDAARWHAVLPACLKAAERVIQPDKRNGAGGGANGPLEAARKLVTYLAGRGLLLTHHGDRAMAAFREAAVDAIVVKGATFAKRIYPDPALRTFTDIDVLIRPQHRSKTAEIMRGLGFELHTFEDRAGKDYFEDKWKLVGQESIIVEVHSDLVHSPKFRGHMSLSYDDVLAAGAGDPEAANALLLIAGTHGAIGHQFDKLQHLVDVLRAATGAAGPIDIERLRWAAQRCGVMLPLIAALDVTGRTFGDPTTRDLARRLDKSFLTRTAGRMLSPALAARAQGEDRRQGSWRRKAFRELLRLDAMRRGHSMEQHT